MAKESVDALIEGGKASAAPPLGPALGPMGVNIGDVVAKINEKTQAFKGMQVPVTVTIDTTTKEFGISVGTPPASALIKKEAGIAKGSGRPSESYVADLKIEQVIKIAQMKSDNLLGKNAINKVREIVGTCASMGVEVEGVKGTEALKRIAAGEFDKKIESGKTELSQEELKEQEEEQKQMQAELEEKREEMEIKAKEILAAMGKKDRSLIVARMREEGVFDEIINEIIPEEVKEPAEGGEAAPAEAAPKEE